MEQKAEKKVINLTGVEDQIESFTEPELARRWKISPGTLRRMRLKGTGPPWFDLQNGTGERVIPRYRKDLAAKWTEQNSISEED
ncbi:hypothetical protein ACFLZQ_01615 [Thermodesulfobacteriota bacterium]